MEAYKFTTIIQKDGTIKIPSISQFANREVEVVILLTPTFQPAPPQNIEQFWQTWQGLLKELDPDQLKAQYLQEKYG